MKSSAFIAAAGIALVIGTMNIDQYRGIGRRMPITSLVMAVSLLALAGVPPLNGFWSKFILFAAAVNAGSTVSWAPYLAIAGILNSALSLGYYAWVIRRMYFDEPTSIPALNQSYVYGRGGMLKVREPRLILAVLAFALAFMVGFGVYPAPLISFAQASVPASDVFSTLPRELQSSMQEHSNSNAESMDGSKSNSNGSTTTYNQSVQAGEVGANGVNSNGNGNGDGKTDGSNNYDGGVNSTANGEVRVVEEDKAVTTVVEGSSHSSPSRSRTP
jgi:NADH-quinone oxidoreductase subunit N